MAGGRVRTRSRAVQVAVTGGRIDYPAPSTFFEQLRCGALDPSRFCDPAIDRQMDEALALQATDPAAADELWARIDRAVTDQAPWVGYATPARVRFLSDRAGNPSPIRSGGCCSTSSGSVSARRRS